MGVYNKRVTPSILSDIYEEIGNVFGGREICVIIGGWGVRMYSKTRGNKLTGNIDNDADLLIELKEISKESILKNLEGSKFSLYDREMFNLEDGFCKLLYTPTKATVDVYFYIDGDDSGNELLSGIPKEYIVKNAVEMDMKNGKKAYVADPASLIYMKYYSCMGSPSRIQDMEDISNLIFNFYRSFENFEHQSYETLHKYLKIIYGWMGKDYIEEQYKIILKSIELIYDQQINEQQKELGKSKRP
ncbi:MAG: hypothetical protein ACP5RT_02895 [Candidatus Micrarchaeia archaeon]